MCLPSMNLKGGQHRCVKCIEKWTTPAKVVLNKKKTTQNEKSTLEPEKPLKSVIKKAPTSAEKAKVGAYIQNLQSEASICLTE